MQNWTVPDDYAYTAKLRLHAWAWELLRRSSAYRLAWDRYKKAHDDDLQALITKGFVRELREEMQAAHSAASRKFGLWEPVNPDLSAVETSDVGWLNAVGVSPLQQWDYDIDLDDFRKWPGYPGSIALSFDFQLPLEAQIEQARDLLFRCRNTIKADGFQWKDFKPKVRVDRPRFKLYLRILDAERAEATLGEMGRRLFGKHKDKRNSVKNALESAHQMSESGYRDLLLRANL